MKKIFFFILLFVSANCLPMKLIKDILTELKKSTNRLQNSVDELTASVAENKNYINDLHNQSSSFSPMFESNLDELQKNLTKRTEQIINQKFATISEDHQQLALNMNKLQSSVNQLISSVTENKIHMNEEHNKTSSILKMHEHILNDTQETMKILDQKIMSNSEDHNNSVLNMDVLQSSIDQLYESVTANKKYMNKEHNETSNLLNKFRHLLDSIKKNVDKQEAENLANDCSDMYNIGLSKSILLQKYNRTILCNMETDVGGWLVIQRRRKVPKQVDFNRNWASYKDGFGDLDTEFWIGNEFLHRITNRKSYELRVDMEDFENRTFYATFGKFIVENEASGYKLRIEEGKGNINQDRLYVSRDENFSTFDRDNDDDSDSNCAQKHHGGFWYWRCSEGENRYANLNGRFPTDRDTENKQQLIHWYMDSGEDKILSKVEMKIRPKK